MSTPPLPSPSTPIKLQIGNTLFTAQISTLTAHSTFFAAQFSGRWPLKPSPDGAYIFEGNGALFGALLRYMRFGRFPVLWQQDGQGGHDVLRYGELQDEAEYFGVEGLAAWLREGRYERAVEMVYSEREAEGDGAVQRVFGGLAGGEIVAVHQQWVTKTRYHCPRKVAAHGELVHCGRECKSAMRGDEYRGVPVKKLGVIVRSVKFRPEYCTEERE
jgi:hypothetical protein